ncbi:MAG TPA: glycosyl hydrolase family 28-related protein [Chitinophaga sp.]|uniref:glycosyl hydrolase family 28-related protein n=1 Tax=Chitinophaga sp. TaxID=1869181 RepID=UPI002B52090D|nr:glycosyl hydrolase family 28-related protein [Chitinophaga sp.]HVI43704.1 glycosyl hydrolase family 28-related protein [Chitinophaga sp.]
MTSDNIASVRSNPAVPSSHEAGIVLGYWTPGDGGGGDFFWDDIATDADNGGTVIRPNIIPPASPGRWKRIINELTNVKWFGAKGDNVNDDTTSLQAAITFASQKGTNCFVPPGVYITTKPIILWGSNALATKGGVTLIGASKTDTIIRKKTHTVYGAANWPVASHANLLGNIDAVIITERIAPTGSDGAYNWGLNHIQLDSSLPGMHPLFPTSRDRVEWGLYTYQGVGINISNVSITADKCIYQRTVYVSLYDGMYLNAYRYGFYMDGSCTSVNIRSSFVVGILDSNNGIAWQLKGRYTSCNNLAADGNKGTVYRFLDWTGSVNGLGSESREANVIFDFDGSQTTISGLVISRPFNPDAIIFRITRSKIKVQSAQFSWTTAFVSGLPPEEWALPRNWLYQVTPSGGSLDLSNIHIVFFSPSGGGNTDNINYFKTPTDRTRNNNFNIKIENIGNSVNNNNQGMLNFKSGEIMPYLGRDNRAIPFSKLYQDVNYFTKALYLDADGSPIKGKYGDYSAIEAPEVGDVFFENKPMQNGAFAWICAVKGSTVGNSAYCKVPIIMGGLTADRPGTNLVAGQQYYNSESSKLEVFDGAAWNDISPVDKQGYTKLVQYVNICLWLVILLYILVGILFVLVSI